MSEWQPIETAPREWVYVHEPKPPHNLTIRAGRCIKVRGTFQGHTEEFICHWSQMEGEHMDPTTHWFVFDCEPLDWPAEEWRELTREEWMEAGLEPPQGGTDAPDR